MSYTPEIAVRIYDGTDGNSSLLVGQDAHQALFGRGFSAMLHRFGFVSRIVANSQSVDKVELITVIRSRPLVQFPQEAVDSTNDEHGKDTFQAMVGLEVRPPLDAGTIAKIGPFIANLLHHEKSDFVLYDCRGEYLANKIYTKPYSAHIIPFPHS